MLKHGRILSYTQHILFVTLLLIAVGALPGRVPSAQERGQSVRIKGENNQLIDLYAESHALIIGVSNYTTGWRDLPGARRDVEAVRAALQKQGFQVETLLDPTRAKFDEVVRRFIGARGLLERNRLLLYFAGHGHTERLTDERDLGYIVPADAPRPERDAQGFNERAVSMDEIEAYARRIKAKHALFVFDSCFSGSLFTVRSDRRVPPAIRSKAARPVREFITSGTGGQTVPDESVFRQYFVRALTTGDADLNQDEFITGEELGMYLSGHVADESRETQTPRYGKIREARLNNGDFVFAVPRPELPPPPPPVAQVTVPAPLPTPVFDPMAIELALWNSAEKSDDLAEYEEYLR